VLWTQVLPGGGADRSGSSTHAPILERSALHDPEENVMDPVVIPGKLFENIFNRTVVVSFDPSSQGISQHVLDQAPCKFPGGRGSQERLQLLDIGKLAPPDQLPGGIDREPAVTGPVAPDRIVVLQGKPQGIHLLMARRAFR